MKTWIASAMAVVLLICAFGCDSKEAQRAAIQKALNYDRSVSKIVGDSRSLGEWLFGASDETTATYVRNLKRVPLEGCPSDFVAAYQRHIAAWETRNLDQINATWLDVVSVARLHEVDFSVSE